MEALSVEKNKNKKVHLHTILLYLVHHLLQRYTVVSKKASYINPQRFIVHQQLK